jgi:phage FluMu protein Com
VALLRIRCGKCNAQVSTGVDMSWDTFRAATLVQRTIECPKCANVQTWTVDDVDRSVFKDKK